MISGSLFRDAIINAAICLENNRQQVDELNVYPVPDGDTGTNMSMTLNMARNELELLGDDIDISKAADVTASALIRGARGNSGVILSLLFRGFSRGLKGLETARGENIANALELGVEAAYKAVMKPTEGTILTVARLSAQKAREELQSTNSTVILWEAVCQAAKKALDATPDMLPTLKKAGVVDAGGKGLVIVFDAMLSVFKGNSIDYEPKKKESGSIAAADTAAEDDDEQSIHFAYCTEFLITKSKNCMDYISLRAYLETVGDCALVVDDDDIIKVHVHTNNPGLVLEKALEYGTINLPKIENMRLQHEGRKKEQKMQSRKKKTPVEPVNKYGFVAVASGHGVESLFKDLGADNIVTGGQTMNPSTDDILEAIEQTPAHTVFVLPNNKNIIMAAEQAIKFADRSVCVLQTRTIPQGMAAMLAYNEEMDLSENKLNMTKAFERVSTGLITFAARDSDFEGHSIKKGEILALDNNKLAFTERDVNKAVIRLLKKLIKNDTSFVTLIYGADVTDESAEKLQALLNQKLNNKAEVMIVNGGQPVYYYIISVE
ncbi:MAG: DAK2 domain-containing protein [Oscillospiraceae bacterium]|nr:DAK2 domain-containing protein [Oscillospiraceae bacterium]